MKDVAITGSWLKKGVGRVSIPALRLLFYECLLPFRDEMFWHAHTNHFPGGANLTING